MSGNLLRPPPLPLICQIPGVRLTADGGTDRTAHDHVFPTASAQPDKPLHAAVSKDVIINSLTGAWVRIYLPHGAQDPRSSSANIGDGGTKSTVCEEERISGIATRRRLPIILYFHGGGFVVGSAASCFAHDMCCKLSAKLKAVVISVDFRSAPEHRLPAAFDDCFAALEWVANQCMSREKDEADPWLAAYADHSRCFLMGQSSGATIVHQIAVRHATQNMLPLQICGLVMDVPFFGGLERSESELRFGNTYVDGVLQMELSDAFWALSLPIGADRSHFYSDFRSSEAPDLAKLKLPPSLVILGGRDPYHDRGVEYVEALRRGGQQVRVLEYAELDHAIHFPEVVTDMENAYAHLTHFLLDCTNSNVNSLTKQTL